MNTVTYLRVIKRRNDGDHWLLRAMNGHTMSSAAGRGISTPRNDKASKGGP